MHRIGRLLISFALLVVGCGPSSPEVEGPVSLTIHQSGQADGMVALSFQGNMATTTPGGAAVAYQLTCQRSGSTWTADVTVTSGMDANSIHEVRVMATDGAASAAVTIVLGGVTFGGTCTAAAGNDSGSLHLASQCMGLASAGDPRTVDAQLAVTFRNCSGT